MNYARLINGALQYVPSPIREGGRDIFTTDPTPYGYKPVTYTEPPAVEEGFVAVPGWTETEESILQTWTVEPEGDIDPAEALEIILGGAGE